MVLQYFDFNNMIYLAQQIGLFTVLLPFILIFAVVYAILSRIEIFNQNKAALTITSLAIAFFALTNYWISYYMQQLFSNLAIALVTLLAVIVLFGLFNKDVTKKAGPLFLIVAIIASIVIILRAFNIYLVQYIAAYLPFIVPTLLIIGAVVLIVVLSKENKSSGQKRSFKDILEDLIGGE